MKSLIIATFTLMSLVSFGQNVDKQLAKINTVEKANEFVKNNPKLDAVVLYISSRDDSTEVANKLFGKKKGDTCTIDGYKYKILESRNVMAYRVCYIYLNGNELSLKSIDSLRSIIIGKYRNGTPYSDLVKQYNMDHTTGDLAWFSYGGGIIDEFVTAAKNHKVNEIYTLDVPSNKWYYVILKTDDDKEVKQLQVLKIKSGA